jgi:hypothetical protein
MVFEARSHKLASRAVFLRRVLLNVLVAVSLVGLSWAIGIIGYHELEGLAWLDAALNAAMILGGMGPVDVLHTEAGKVFAMCYALYSGVVFLAVAALIFAPLAHRLLHRFHLE